MTGFTVLMHFKFDLTSVDLLGNLGNPINQRFVWINKF